MKKSTRSTSRKDTFNTFVTDILPILVGGEDGWVTAADVAAVQTTCRSANDILSSASADIIWRALAQRIWPDVGRLIVVNGDDAGIGGGGDEQPVRYATYRDLFVNYPRTWLTMEAEKVREIPKWSKNQHLSKRGGVLECGKCGCNCNGDYYACPGIPMTSEYRWERREKKMGFDNRVTVPQGEGYHMSNFRWVVVNYFCEPCFERLDELEVVNRDDYDRVLGTNIFDEVNE